MVFRGNFPQGKFTARLGLVMGEMEEGGDLPTALLSPDVPLRVVNTSVEILRFPERPEEFERDTHIALQDPHWFNMLNDTAGAILDRASGIERAVKVGSRGSQFPEEDPSEK